jgi:hypothetical protein
MANTSSASSGVPFRWQVDQETADRVQKSKRLKKDISFYLMEQMKLIWCLFSLVGQAVTNWTYNLANEPSLGLFYVQDNVFRSAPKLIDVKVCVLSPIRLLSKTRFIFFITKQNKLTINHTQIEKNKSSNPKDR